MNKVKKNYLFLYLKKKVLQHLLFLKQHHSQLANNSSKNLNIILKKTNQRKSLTIQPKTISFIKETLNNNKSNELFKEEKIKLASVSRYSIQFFKIIYKNYL